MKTIQLIVPVILALFASFQNVQAQNEEAQSDQVFMMVEEMPQFPGGEKVLREYISGAIRYPKEAQENGIQGRVYVTFVIDTLGSVVDAKIARGVDPSLDKEALRVVSELPQWQPGKQRGKLVKVAYTVPISFALEGGEISPKNETLTVTFANNRMTLSGSVNLIEKMRPYMQTGKPNAFLGKDSGSLIFSSSEVSLDDPVFYIVEEMPEFPGGEAALRSFIAQAIQYPQEAHEKGIQGKVYITFVVSKEGMVKDSKIARGVDPLLDNEALRVVNELPQWQPGKQRGKEVNVSYTVPIQFVLQ
jgi:TonB family protein